MRNVPAAEIGAEDGSFLAGEVWHIRIPPPGAARFAACAVAVPQSLCQSPRRSVGRSALNPEHNRSIASIVSLASA